MILYNLIVKVKNGIKNIYDVLRKSIMYIFKCFARGLKVPKTTPFGRVYLIKEGHIEVEQTKISLQGLFWTFMGCFGHLWVVLDVYGLFWAVRTRISNWSLGWISIQPNICNRPPTIQNNP